MNTLLPLSRKYSDSSLFCLVLWAAANFSLFTITFYLDNGESKKGRMADALAHGGDEGRDKLR